MVDSTRGRDPAGCDQPRHLRGCNAFLADAMKGRLSPVVQELPMFTAEQFRAKAAECAESLKNSVVPSQIREFQRARQSFSLLAQNKDWLAENFDKLIRVQDMLPQDDIVERNVDRKAVAETKEHISSMPRGGPHYEVEHHPHRPPTGALRS